MLSAIYSLPLPPLRGRTGMRVDGRRWTLSPSGRRVGSRSRPASPHHHITTSPHHYITTSPHNHITTSPHHHITTSGGGGDCFRGATPFPLPSLRGRPCKPQANSQPTASQHIEVVGPDWQQTAAGMAEFVDRLPTVLRKMVGVGEALPRVIASGRGPGFYQSSTGHICREYAAALGNHGFRPFATEDASHQPPDVPDVLPHETAVAWIRTYLKKHPFSRTGSLDDQETAVRAMFAECTEHINASYDVEGLCRSFPRRLQALVDNGGLRLRH